MIITMAASDFPTAVWGAISPYPTVVSVTTAQYMLAGILVNPFSCPSMMYISEPMMTTRTMTANMKTVILGRLALKAFMMVLELPDIDELQNAKHPHDPEKPDNDQILGID